MPFRGVTFSGQNVTPKNDGGLYNAHYGDGILWGCSMNISGDDLVIQSGEFIAGGRVCFVDGATNVDLSGRVNNTGYIQVIMNYDLSQAEGSQWYTTFVESATTTFPALTQDNINDNDTLYQLELAVVQISGGNITSILSSVGMSLLRAGSQFIGSSDGLGNDLFLIGNGNNVGIRPNGDASGQVYWNTSGQQVGGHNGITSRTASGTFSANWTTLWTHTLDKGLWIIQGNATFTCSSATQAVLVIGRSGLGINPNDDAIIGRQYTYVPSAGTKIGIDLSATLFPSDFDALGVSTITIGLYSWFSQSCTKDGGSLCSVRLA